MPKAAAKKKKPAEMNALLVPAGRAAMLRCQYDWSQKDRPKNDVAAVMA
jgi:hypothetical protein